MATRARSGRHCSSMSSGYETTVSAMATRARSGRHWAQCPRLRDNSERYGDQSSLWAPLGSMSAATRQQ
ncbi:Hypothetical predicted protein [Octopus vulgaris]|uniref:Uncharacterized protein n=1 Tax=Octopus vulgaris TaxID=6645 RepID=A0AA36C2I8_OCTVU|nr:Hypothetical predicted protein [Octopus vulgaris]